MFLVKNSGVTSLPYQTFKDSTTLLKKRNFKKF